jgi:hypothetical protein
MKNACMHAFFKHSSATAHSVRVCLCEVCSFRIRGRVIVLSVPHVSRQRDDLIFKDRKVFDT